MKTLPIGVSTFESIIRSDALYVDKTEYLYQLVKDKTPQRYFFSRPRRFGKSLTCSTLNALFSGHKNLFKNLWIGQSDYDWTVRPVIHFDFSEISHNTTEALINGLQSSLDVHAKKYTIELHAIELKEKLVELISTLGQTIAPVVIIIDEYDKPITNLIDTIEQAEQSRNILREFYGTLKGETVDAHMHFLFMTGVSKFSK